ncbi:MAG: MBL fold metallo-hydrolase, partial [Rhodothermia bacterium]
AQPESAASLPVRLRVASFNIGDIRSADLSRPDHPRLTRIAQEISELRPDIILLNEIAYDWPAGSNAERFVDNFLTEGDDDAVRYRSFMPPPNTGLASGFDLDRNGRTVSVVPEIPVGSVDGKQGPQTPEGRAYGGDSWGFGMFPGQYGLAVLVSERFEILVDEVRTFQKFKWSSLPEPLRPVDPATGEWWYDDEAWSAFPLSSKTHVDVPVRVGPETVLHVLASHPTPPAFDGPEGRNKRRNHDEIRFWNYYLHDADFIVDDGGTAGGLGSGERFVIVGDLNADPDEGSSFGNPIGTFLFDHPRVNGDFVPEGDLDIEGLDSDDTARWGLRVDYVLPSAGAIVTGGAVHRHAYTADEVPSDHFPVWLDLEIPVSRDQLCGNGGPALVVLGVAQDAGYPQAGSKHHPAFDDFSLRHFATSLAVLDPADGTRWMFEATPDFKDQLHGIDTLMPSHDVPGLDGVFLTHAHIGHYTGLMQLGHEAIGAKGIPVFAMPRMAEFLSSNGPWDQLVRYNNISLRVLANETPVNLNSRITVTPFLVPHRDEYSETVGYRITGPTRTVVFIPDINKWELLDATGTTIEEIIGDADLALVDGSFYSSGELGGRDMSEFPHPFVVESMARFDSAASEIRSRITFIHLNHTNPALDVDSPQYDAVVAKGYRVAREGQCYAL